MCPPVGVRLLLSTAALRSWRAMKLNVKLEFLQTGHFAREIYVLFPRESSDRGRLLWLLLTAACGLYKANAKRQEQTDALMFDTESVRAPLVQELFLCKYENVCSVTILAKAVDVRLLAGYAATTKTPIDLIYKKSGLGTVGHGPG